MTVWRVKEIFFTTAVSLTKSWMSAYFARDDFEMLLFIYLFIFHLIVRHRERIFLKKNAIKWWLGKLKWWRHLLEFFETNFSGNILGKICLHDWVRNVFGVEISKTGIALNWTKIFNNVNYNKGNQLLFENKNNFQ